MNIYSDGVNWIALATDGEEWPHPDPAGEFPPLTGWPLGSNGSPAISLDYSRWFIVSEDFVRRDHADYLARANLDDGQIDQWENNGVCVVKKCAIYPQAKQWTVGEHAQGVRWGENGTTCGAGSLEILYDVGLNIVYDVDGYPILVQPS